MSGQRQIWMLLETSVYFEAGVSATPALGDEGDPPATTDYDPQPSDQPPGVNPGNTLYIRPAPLTATSLERLLPSRSASVEVVGQFAHNGETITFGTMVDSGEDLSDTLSASFTDLWNSLAVEGTDPPIITSVPASPSDALEQEELSPLTDPGIPVIPRYSIVTLDASLDYTTLASKSGIEATPALITDAEDTAAYNTAVLAAQNAIVPWRTGPGDRRCHVKDGAMLQAVVAQL